jgi:hypothetical protein
MPSSINYYRPICQDSTTTVDASTFGTTAGTFEFPNTLCMPAGNNRALIISLGSENQGTDTTVSAATYNGVALTQLDMTSVTSSGFFAQVRQYIIKDADLPAAAGTYNVSFSISTTTSTVNLFQLQSSITQLHNISQDATILNYNKASGALDTTTMTIYATPDRRGSWVLASSQCGQSGSYGVPFPQVLTYRQEWAVTTTHAGSIYKYATDTTTLGITQTYTGGSFNRQCMTAAVLAPSL